jgi:hypothetical protein
VAVRPASARVEAGPLAPPQHCHPAAYAVTDRRCSAADVGAVEPRTTSRAELTGPHRHRPSPVAALNPGARAAHYVGRDVGAGAALAQSPSRRALSFCLFASARGTGTQTCLRPSQGRLVSPQHPQATSARAVGAPGYLNRTGTTLARLTGPLQPRGITSTAGATHPRGCGKPTAALESSTTATSRAGTPAPAVSSESTSVRRGAC